METGQFRAIIDRKYPLAAMADAYRYVETGQKVGIVVIDVVAAEGTSGPELILAVAAQSRVSGYAWSC